MKRNLAEMIRARDPYDVFSALLTIVLVSRGDWAMAGLCALWLIWLRDRVVRDDA